MQVGLSYWTHRATGKTWYEKPMEEVPERRKQGRYKTKNGSSVRFKSRPAMSGRLINVSRGGLAFDYLAEKRETNESMNLRLVSTSFDALSSSLSVKTIWDVRIRGRTSDASSTIRRCGVRFDDLTGDQKLDVDRLIRTYTTSRPKTGK